MHEYLTEALVLDKTAANETDLTVDLYTKELGRIKAKVTSGQKIISKLSPHLEPLNFSLVRLTEKNGFVVADALTQNKIKISKQALKLLAAIRELVFFEEIDPKLWFWLKKSLSAKSLFFFGQFLKILGYDPKLAECHRCHSRWVKYFLVADQIFLCRRCGFKIPPNALLLNL
jgi:DNA repair protein RecO